MKVIFGTTNKRKIEDLQNIVNKMNLDILELSLDLHQDNPEVITTEYEDKFVSKGNVIYYTKIQKRK